MDNFDIDFQDPLSLQNTPREHRCSQDLFYTDPETRCTYPRPYARGGGGRGGETHSYDDDNTESDTTITRTETFWEYNPKTGEWEVKSKKKISGIKPKPRNKRRDQQNTRW